MRLFLTKSATPPSAAAMIRKLAGRHRRDLPIDLCAIHFDDTKAKKDPEAPVTFEGYGSVWGRTDSYGDTLHKGAFEEALKARRPIMLYSHNPSRVPGKWIDYGEDNKGLFLKGELTPGHSEASDLAASLRHESLTGLSIGGYTVDSTPKHAKNPWGGSDITKFDLYEVSPVSMPAEQEARIDTASVKQMLECTDIKLSDFEDSLREAGFSKIAASAWVSRLVRLVRGDPEPVGALDKVAGETLEALRAFKLPTSLFSE